MSSTSTLMPASLPKPKSGKIHMFHSISKTLSPALSKSSARKHRSHNSTLALPTPPESPNRISDNNSSTRTSSDPSDDDDFVDVQLSESEKQYMSGKRVSKIMKEAKEWQAFFKIGKDDFERERKLPKRDSHSLTSSLKHHSSVATASGISANPQDQEELTDSSAASAHHPAAMKRVKSDQIVYSQPGNSPVAQDQSSPPIQEKSPPNEQLTPPIPLSPTIEESPSVRSRNSLEVELGLSAADADAIDRLTRNLEDEPLPHLAEEMPSATLSPEPISPTSQPIEDAATSPVSSSVVPSQLEQSPAIVPAPSSDLPAEPTPSIKSPAQRRRHKVTVEDFDIMRVLGKGCAGKVLMVKYRRPGGKRPSQVYAMKSIKKNHVLSHRELQHTLTEQSVLRRVADEPDSNPFIVRLWTRTICSWSWIFILAGI
ncbi:AGC protein kinase [Puccinia sorghi]|uniref:non-specific serine/threonine protein kinase n=1 Tax=Puccinia sorghi TaxID=27349 RepID=A0A0L6VBG4_9BASI|nr:AGC protein kinase [Puccinia sorghi]